ncbi:rhs element Vgr protein [Fibrisoma limi BUZ 3]|uniref:Rhs element Vgr protein n=1 Tax=Fibrisoma limi BUZ 3 TaxID=1185876 RepID=I2GM21_9BACT|nr:phage baseplate assembly protein V [Fibrisoma limi]CCH54947.1 rhs element Vgr protein [Fibrisoma limi BUZ 3]
MAQQVTVNVSVGGTAIKHFTHLRIDQSMFTHHTFEIVVPIEDLEGKGAFFFQSAHQRLCGKDITISFKPFFKNVPHDFEFKGIVTELVLHNDSEMVNSYIIKGHSPTILLEDGVQRRAFVRQTLGQIFGAVLFDYPQNLLPRSVSPKNMDTLDYKAQYDESNFDFMSRLAAEYGEWFYYNGTQLVIGKPDTKTQPFVVDGVQHFDMSIGLKPNRFSMTHYNYVKHESYGSGSQPVGLGQFGSFAYSQSQSLFGRASQSFPLKDIQVQAQLDTAVEALNATNAADLVRFQGSGENPNLSVGVMVNVTGQKLNILKQFEQVSVGKYRITHITHTVDNIGNYENFFEAIPDASDFPPRNPHARMPVALPEIATIITNEDPLQLGRVRVQFHWPNQLQGKSSWIRVAFPYTGSDRGMLFIPEKDDQVLISYEANHVDFPVVVGSLYHKTPSTNYWFDQNLQKIIRTKGGNKLVFKDKPGEQEIFITNANKKGTNLHISFKGDGTITLHTEGLIQLQAKDIKMTAKENIEMNAKNMKITVQKDINVTSTNTDVSSTSEIKQSARTISVKAIQQTTVQATQVEVSGNGLVDIKAPMVKINS